MGRCGRRCVRHGPAWTHGCGRDASFPSEAGLGGGDRGRRRLGRPREGRRAKCTRWEGDLQIAVAKSPRGFSEAILEVPILAEVFLCLGCCTVGPADHASAAVLVPGQPGQLTAMFTRNLQHAASPEDSLAFAVSRGLLLGCVDQGADVLPVVSVRKVGQAWQLGQGDMRDDFVVTPCDVLRSLPLPLSMASPPIAGAVEPDPLSGAPTYEGTGAMNAGPLEGTRNQIFLRGLCEYV